MTSLPPLRNELSRRREVAHAANEKHQALFSTVSAARECAKRREYAAALALVQPYLKESTLADEVSTESETESESDSDGEEKPAQSTDAARAPADTAEVVDPFATSGVTLDELAASLQAAIVAPEASTYRRSEPEPEPEPESEPEPEPEPEFKVGDAVVLAPGVTIEEKHILADGADGIVAEMSEELDDDQPYKVVDSAGATYWYEVDHLAAVADPSEALAAILDGGPESEPESEPELEPEPELTAAQKATGMARHFIACHAYEAAIPLLRGALGEPGGVQDSDTHTELEALLFEAIIGQSSRSVDERKKALQKEMSQLEPSSAEYQQLAVALKLLEGEEAVLASSNLPHNMVTMDVPDALPVVAG